ncbi:hypothetical protein F5B17DRAFT_425899 [Nemania serpens]|nr:hypothetical protein F5B17DRAFT_425899 [Nemania serpens]
MASHTQDKGLLTPLETPVPSERDMHEERRTDYYDHNCVAPRSLLAEMRAWRRGAGWAVAGLAAALLVFVAVALLSLAASSLVACLARLVARVVLVGGRGSLAACEAADSVGTFRCLWRVAETAPKPLPWRVFSDGTWARVYLFVVE